MQIGFTDVLTSVLSIVLLMLPGFIFAKLKLLPEKAEEGFSTVVLYCCQTFLVFMSFQKYEYSPEIGKNMLIVLGLSALIHLIMIGIVFLFVRGNDKSKVKIIRYSAVFGNCGFMGIPFLQMLFSSSDRLGEILIYAAVIIAVFNVMNWTFGAYMITGDIKRVSVKKILFNPVIIAVIVGFILFVTVKRPLNTIPESGTFTYSLVNKIFSAFNYLSEAVTPLSMIVIGMKLANIKLKDLALNLTGYMVSALKLILTSLVSILVVAFLPIGAEIKYPIFLLLSMPTATSATLFAVKFNEDANFATVCVLLSTLLSILTIPLMFLLFSGVFNVVI